MGGQVVEAGRFTPQTDPRKLLPSYGTGGAGRPIAGMRRHAGFARIRAPGRRESAHGGRVRAPRAAGGRPCR